MRPVYIVNEDGYVYKITEICNCKKCKERRQVEFRIENLNGEFEDYLKFSEFRNFVKNIAYTPSCLIFSNNIDEYISIMLHEKLLEV